MQRNSKSTDGDDSKEILMYPSKMFPTMLNEIKVKQEIQLVFNKVTEAY